MNPENYRKAEHLKKTVIKKSSWAGFVLIIAVMISATVVKGKVERTYRAKLFNSGAEIINIDSMKIYGDLEEPEPAFPHDTHTRILINKEKNCSLCHISVDNKTTYKFMRTGNPGRQELMDIYHKNCIGCHEERSGVTGPVTCGECHIKNREIISGRESAGFDKSLHYRHSRASEKKCEQCHHTLNKKTGKLVYEKGAETTCRHCHGKVGVKELRSMKDASHLSCITCHIKKVEESKKAGPVECMGCHDKEEQNRIKKIDPVPRLMRNQPDALMIKTGHAELDTSMANRMDFVLFNHKVHEEKNVNCRTCHHKSFNSCSSCHSVEGKKEGGGITLEKSMHTPDSRRSCTGCHSLEKQKTECVGCHAFIDESDYLSDKSCSSCHIKTMADDEASLKVLVKKRTMKTRTGKTVEIPEKIIIDRLADKYEPSVFPHRKIVNTLLKEVDGNSLAAAFHNKKEMLCRGCHHNLPETEKPSGCIACHSASYKNDDELPGLKGAYHIQCMECHENMSIDRNGCTDCHKKTEQQ